MISNEMTFYSKNYSFLSGNSYFGIFLEEMSEAKQKQTQPSNK